MKKGIILFVLMFWLFLSVNQVFGCTVFNSNQSGQGLVGNNEDWYLSSNAKVWFIPRTKYTYGRICFGYSLKEAAWYLALLGNYPMGGMNDQGLFVDATLCPSTKAPKVTGKPLLIYPYDEILKRCATVEEAIKMAGKCNFPFNLSGMHTQVMVADRNGNSAVIQWLNNELKIIRKEKPFQVITNFWLSAPELGNYPCSRYDKANAMLQANNEHSISYFASILENVSQYRKNKKGKEVGTLYSNIYDLKNGVVDVYYKRNFNQKISFNLAAELKKGKRVYQLKELFAKKFNQD
jgi:penicillin V acylase-like amidase (Ntn superfamily)